MAWTEAQQKVIDARNKNILVSAAAGSGKTAVLVERIISMISEGDHPIDIDHLLVVTFTNAAAAQMRERIGKAIDKKLLLEPDNSHLQKQISLLQSAQITTIHSFCLNVIRNYFHHIDLDPSFKMADESEVTLMKSDVLADVLECWYEEGREDFHTFIESYSYSKSDQPVEDLVLQLYQFAMSNPWPREWILKMQEVFQIATLDEMDSTDWMKELLRYVKVVLADLALKNEEALRRCNEPGGPQAYITALLSDQDILDTLRTASSYQEYAELFTGVSYTRLSSKKEEGVVQAKKDQVKELREEVKKGIKDLAGQFFYQSPEEMLADLQKVKEVMKVLFELTLDFMEAFAAKKEEKNLIDFNDLEHFALNILVEEKDGEKLPTRAAMELSELFEEILIDEYQDSNLVQETLLRSISREHVGLSNRFMVGDVKQSIYKFRLAMPELFLEKYKEYSTSETMDTGEINYSQRIDLDKNFRSRKIVLDGVNLIFEQIMTEAVGGITYDEAASLKYGELFEELQGEGTATTGDRSEEVMPRISDNVELILVTEEDEEGNETNSPAFLLHNTQENADSSTAEDSEEAVYSKKELEAKAIAKRIRELVNPETGLMLFDRDTLAHRKAEYRDIVILLRSMTGWAELFVNTLMQEGIPAYADTGTGYFQTVEIMTLLNMLRIIDNPRQDIPFVGVLYSPMVGLTTTDLAMIRVSAANSSIYQAVKQYVAEGGENGLREKLNLFLTNLEWFRSKVRHTPIHELIQEVLERTGYYYYVLAMPGGERRKANVDMLVSQAVRFEKGSYSGLFHFIRYIEKLHKYEVDFGEAATAGEQDNTVRIMSIHKSKGLEFPIVFVSGLSKQYNTQDLRSSIVIHAEYGVGPECIDSKLRTKIPTLLKKVIQKKIQIENLGEELRVLYVALTRAKEKLIMTGYLNSREEIKGKEFSFFALSSAKSYLELILPAMYNRMDRSEFHISVLSKSQLLQEELIKQVSLHMDEEILRSIEPDQVYDQGIREEIKTRFNYSYPYQKDAGLRVKMTVSELKKLGQFIDEEHSENLYQNQITSSTKEEAKYEEITQPASLMQEDSSRGDIPNMIIPDFIRGTETTVTGTDRGTLYHKVLELLDLTKVCKEADLFQEFERMIQKNRISEEDIRKLKQDYIIRFIHSEVAGRMRKAQETGKLYKEKQFVIGIQASEIIEDKNSEELILVQGIVDAFFEEEGELVLLDYKSDIVENELQLKNRYQVQLIYYRKALEQILKKRVKEMIIYSLYLGKEIRVD